MAKYKLRVTVRVDVIDDAGKRVATYQDSDDATDPVDPDVDCSGVRERLEWPLHAAFNDACESMNWLS